MDGTGFRQVIWAWLTTSMIVTAASAAEPSRVRSAVFGELPTGEVVTKYTLRNNVGTSVSIIDLGATIISMNVADRNGTIDDVVLGFDNVEQYITESPYFGAIVGRYANRIAKGRFSLNGVEYSLTINNGDNHLHGGREGFDRRLWRAYASSRDDSAQVVLSLVSEDDDQGYPGRVEAEVVYELTDQDRLRVTYTARSDADTVINLSQHSYFNLNGHGSGSIESHELKLNADHFTVIDEALIPTGEIRSVAGTPMDFRQPTQIGLRIDQAGDDQLKFGRGYDHNWVVRQKEGGGVHEVAQLYARESGRKMVVYSDQPGIQFYSGNFLDGSLTGKGNSRYVHRSGLCLETQHFPDSPNQPSFPSTVLRAGDKFTSTTIFEFGTTEE